MASPLIRPLTLLVMLSASVAQAAPGDHIRAGNAEITPSVELAAEFRTNVYLAEGTAAGGNATTPGTDLRLQPKIDMTVEGTDAVFNLSGQYTARKYLTSGLTGLDRFTDFGIDASLNALPDASAGFKLSDGARLVGYETEQTDTTADPYLQHFNNEAEASVSIHPGGALEGDIGGKFHYDDYNVPVAATATGDPNLNTRIGYGPSLEARWKFLPKTAFVLDYDLAWYKWQKNLLNAIGGEGTTTDIGAVLAVPDFVEWQAMAGLRGRFTEKLVLEALSGWGSMTFDDQTVLDAAKSIQFDPSGLSADYGADLKSFGEGLLFTLDGTYSIDEGNKATLGYRKDFTDAYFTNFVAYHMLYGRYQGLFARRYGLLAEMTYKFEQYNGEVARNDHVVRGKLDLGYHITDYLQVGVGEWWRRRASADHLHPEIEYDDFNTHVGLTFEY